MHIPDVFNPQSILKNVNIIVPILSVWFTTGTTTALCCAKMYSSVCYHNTNLRVQLEIKLCPYNVLCIDKRTK
jgi:hypothetical protein